MPRNFTENILREVVPRAYSIDMLPEFKDRGGFNRLPNYDILPSDHRLREAVGNSLSQLVGKVLGLAIGVTRSFPKT